MIMLRLHKDTRGHGTSLEDELFTQCISQFQLHPAPPPFLGYCWAFARLVSPGGRAFANFALPGGRAFANPGAISELLTAHAVSYQERGRH